MKQGIAPAGTGALTQSGKPNPWILIISSSLLGLVLVGSMLTGFFTNATSAAAQADKAKLDQTLAAARTTMYVPESLLTPITQREQRVPATEDGTIGGYQGASTTYVSLTQQVLAIEHMNPAQAKSLAQSDLARFSAGVATLIKGNFIE